MELKLAIVHLDMVVDTLTLEPGEYSIGRSSDNNIVVQHMSLEPEEGKIFFQDDRWYYEEKGSGNPKLIPANEVVYLSDQIGLATQGYVESGASRLSHLEQMRDEHQSMLNKRLMIASAFVVILLAVTFGGYQISKNYTAGAQSSQLLSRVRHKIVEFETNRDEKAIGDFKKYAGLKDEDFRENIGFCTGFLVGPNIILTAAHCLMGHMVIDLNNDFYVKTHDGEKHQVVEVLGFDSKRDYLFLRMKDMESYGHLDFAKDYKIEQKVYTVGNVHGQGIAVRDGIVSSETVDSDDPEVNFLRYSAGTSPGNSGGPLLDENGDVVALVFASTSTENFNIGTPTQDLKKAYDQFVTEDGEKQSVTLAMKRVMNFRPEMMLRALALPYLPQFDDYPEISQAFNDVSIDVEVPIPFGEFDKQILSPLNKKVIETYFSVQEVLKKNNETYLDWKSFVSDKTPAILPSQFDGSQNVFVKVQDRYFPYVTGLIDSPSKPHFNEYKEALKKEDKFDFQSYGYNILYTEKKFDLLKDDVFYKTKNESGSKQRLYSLSQPPPYSQMVLIGKDDLRRPGFFGLKLFMKNYIGDQGVISDFHSPFVRPIQDKIFTIKDLDLNEEDIQTAEVEDRLNRKWRRSRAKIFEATNLITYCTDLPEATFCVGRVMNVYNNHLLSIIENNFRKFVLSHLLINPYFWEKSALVKYIEDGHAKNLPLMTGVDLKQKGNGISGSFSGFPVTFELPEAAKVESIRLQTGLYGDSKSSEWTGYGLEWVQRDSKKDQVCGLGLEAFESQSTFILNFLRDRRKQEKLKKIKGEAAQPLPGVWYKPYRGGDKPFQLYGYCAPLEEDPRVAGQYFVDFKNAKPLKYKYKVSQ